MKTIKAIIFGALITVAFVSGFMLFCFLGTVEVYDLWATVKMFMGTSLAFWASVFSLKYLYERWYKRNDESRQD